MEFISDEDEIFDGPFMNFLNPFMLFSNLLIYGSSGEEMWKLYVSPIFTPKSLGADWENSLDLYWCLIKPGSDFYSSEAFLGLRTGDPLWVVLLGKSGV